MEKGRKATRKIPKASVESDKEVHHYQVILLIHILEEKAITIIGE